jgi:tetratricopeptide (TPR) repeat protein
MDDETYGAYGPDPDKQLDALLKNGQYAQALDWLQAWLAREPWNGEVLLRMAVVHWLAGEPAQTLRDLDAFLEQDPNNAEALARRAQALLTLGKYEDAAAALAKAEAIDAHTPGVLLNKALILEAQGQYPDALASLDAYLELMPQDHLALARRSQYHRQLGQLPEALADAQASAALRPDDPEAHLAEALARVALEQGDEALFSCDRCLQLRPFFLPALRLKVDLLADLGRLSEAETILNLLQAKDPESPGTNLLRARLATERADFPGALHWMNRFLEDSADEPYGYYRRGIIHYRMGEFQKALADFQAYARLAPGAMEAYEEQYLCFIELERFDEAVAAASMAISLQPQHPRPRFNLAFALLLTGRQAEALQAFHAAFDCAPENEDVLLRIHLALTMQASLPVRLAWLHEAAERQGARAPLARGLYAEALLDAGRFTEGLALAQALLPADPERTFTYLLNVKALCLLDRYPEALSVADSGVNALPQDGRLRLGRAMVLRDLNMPDEALQDLEIAAMLLPGDPEVPRQQALVHGSQGEVAPAIRLLREALQCEGDHTDTHFWLAYFLVHRRRYREALTSADAMLAATPQAAEGHFVRGLALRGLRRHAAADGEFAFVRDNDPALLERMKLDPVIAALITPTWPSLRERVRRTLRRG